MTRRPLPATAQRLRAASLDPANDQGAHLRGALRFELLPGLRRAVAPWAPDYPHAWISAT